MILSGSQRVKAYWHYSSGLLAEDKGLAAYLSEQQMTLLSVAIAIGGFIERQLGAPGTHTVRPREVAMVSCFCPCLKVQARRKLYDDA